MWAKEWDQPRADHPQRVFVVYEPVENQSYQASPDVSIVLYPYARCKQAKRQKLRKEAKKNAFSSEKQPKKSRPSGNYVLGNELAELRQVIVIV